MNREAETTKGRLGFFERVRQLWGPLSLLAACFGAGMLLQYKIDSGRVELLEQERDNYKNRPVEAVDIEDYFAKFDIAQMSPTGEYGILIGDSYIYGGPSVISPAIDSAIAAMGNREYVKAISKLKAASDLMPDFPFTYFLLGIAELSNKSSRATPYFNRAHTMFTSLLRVRPHNASMRFYDAMCLTYMGFGDSATIQLFLSHKYDPVWNQIGCRRMLLQYDSTSLSAEERLTWTTFIDALKSMRCDTTNLSIGSAAVDAVPPYPKIKWPTGYEQLDK